LSGLPLLEGVLKYAGENNISFCMPGHKGGKGFLETPEGEKFYNSFLKCDITEVEGVDNLHKAEGIIKESSELLSQYYGSKKSYFLVNGSTCGNLVMIYSVFNEGDKIIVERNCHRSILNGIILRKLKPVYIKNKINCRYNAPLSIDGEHLLTVMENNKDAKGIILTYPSYYGTCTDLKSIVDRAHEYGMKVLIDSAHGAHFGVSSVVPESAVKLGADMVVVSAHKTLPSLTQTAFLHIGQEVCESKVDFYVSALQSTSPSYLFMCSMDYARYYLEQYGEQAYEELIRLTGEYKNKINEIPYLHILGREESKSEECSEVYDIDCTRFVVNVKQGISAYKLFDYLGDCGITGEMCDGSNIVLIFSPFNYREDFEALYQALLKCPLDSMKEEVVEPVIHSIPGIAMLPFEAIDLKKEVIEFRNSKGRICGENIVPYPPGVPLVIMGEIIDMNIINMVQYYLENKAKVLGVNDGCISVIAKL
jgi:arginine/lysine/ornithine decarboxylase